MVDHKAFRWPLARRLVAGSRSGQRTARALALPLGLLLLGLGSQGSLPGRAEAKALLPRLPAPAGPLPVAEYDALLKRYVDDQGRVDYAALKSKDADTVEKLYAVIAATGPDKTPELYPGRPAALAYYLSAYNLLVWKNVLDSLPKLKQVDEGLYRFFRNPDFMVDGKEADLDDLEKKIIRKRFKDGRIHFALNCASGGCPKLPRTAFTAAAVDQQLDAEARRFCNEPRNVRFDPAAKTVTLSMIFKWYKDDFGGADAAVLGFINKYRAADQQLPAGTQLKYVDYDWHLNDLSLAIR
jgi:hypothetical protein